MSTRADHFRACVSDDVNRNRRFRLTFPLLVFLPVFLVEEVLEAIVYYDLALVFLDAPEARVCLETSKTRVGHGTDEGDRARDGRREPISVRSEEIVGVTEERRRVTGDVQEWAVVNSPGAKLLDDGAGIK